MKYAIGIDTGGTCTDAVLYDFDTGTVLCSNKALTTYDDLTRGILEALDGLDLSLCQQACAAGLSTTLATNACVENKFRRPKLLLMGIDRKGIARFGADYGFTDPDDIIYLPCKTTITGEIIQEPDWQLLRTQTKEWFHDAEGCAICEIYGMRNHGVLEKQAAAIIQQETGLPVVCASALFSGLSSLERAASAVLNAGLLPLTCSFLDAVSRAFQERNIHADMYLVRSDSSLMGLDYAAHHAVETLLSGPAASALGGSTLAQADQAVIVDMGGTTTDIALMENGLPLLSEDGIRVGKWRTMVKGLFAHSFALGGDSGIRWDKQGQLTIGPARMIPLCVLASHEPQILTCLEDLLQRMPCHTLPLHEFLTLNRKDWHMLSLTEQERQLCAHLEHSAMSVEQAAQELSIDKYNLHTDGLERAGVILRAGLTPTDIMHLRGDYTQYERRASVLGARFVSASMQCSLEQLCERVYTEISHRIFLAVSQMLLEHASPYYQKSGIDDGVQQLLELQWSNQATKGSSMLQYCFQSKAVLVGIGGPIHLFLPTAAKALDAKCIIPDCAPVANALGAVTGRMTRTLSAEIRPHGMSIAEEADTDEIADFEVLYTGQTKYFAKEPQAIAWLTERMKQDAAADLRAQGATGAITFQVKQKDLTAPAYSGVIKISTCIYVTAESSLQLTAKKGEIEYV